MTSRWIAIILATATALTPIAASAQGGGFGARILREAGNARQTPTPAPRATPAPRPVSRVEPVAVPQSNVGNNQPQFQRRGDGGGGRRGGGEGGGGFGRRGGFDRGPATAPTPPPAPAPVSRPAPLNRGATLERGRTDYGNDRGNGGFRRGDGEGRGRWNRNDGYRAPPVGAPPVYRDDNGRNGDGRIDGRRRLPPVYSGDDGRSGDGRYDRRRGDGEFGRDILRDARRGDDGRYDRSRGYGDGRGYDRDQRDGYNRDGRYDRDGRYGRDDRYDGRRYDNRRYDDRYGSHRRWDREWRRDNRYDWYGHRNRYRSLYRWPTYYSPYRGWSYRRLSIGFSLWPLFYSDRYWINDPWTYRLPDVYGPYRWVRYYDDALLVDLRTGEVVDVIYSFFW